LSRSRRVDEARAVELIVLRGPKIRILSRLFIRDKFLFLKVLLQNLDRFIYLAL